MTITYRNGTVLKPIVLSHDQHEIRAIAAGCDDVLAFTAIHGTWISEENEPVAIEFDCQRRAAVPVFSEDEFVCPKELAAQLISALLKGGDRPEAVANTVNALCAGEFHAVIQRTELQHTLSTATGLLW